MVTIPGYSAEVKKIRKEYVGNYVWSYCQPSKIGRQEHCGDHEVAYCQAYNKSVCYCPKSAKTGKKNANKSVGNHNSAAYDGERNCWSKVKLCRAMFTSLRCHLCGGHILFVVVLHFFQDIHGEVSGSANLQRTNLFIAICVPFFRQI